MSMHRLPQRDVVHLADVHTRPKVFSVWERYRHRQAHWLVECLAETVSSVHRNVRNHFPDNEHLP